MNTALYLSLHNTGETADALVGARSAVARAVELHESRMEGYIMRMRPVSRLPLPAGGQVTLKPGGFHIMLIDLQQDLKPGDTVTVELRFEQSTPITITAPVRQP